MFIVEKTSNFAILCGLTKFENDCLLHRVLKLSPRRCPSAEWGSSSEDTVIHGEKEEERKRGEEAD